MRVVLVPPAGGLEPLEEKKILSHYSGSFLDSIWNITHSSQSVHITLKPTMQTAGVLMAQSSGACAAGFQLCGFKLLT